MRPGCVDKHGQWVGLECDANAGLLAFSSYENEEMCSSETPSWSLFIPVDTCLPVLIRVPDNTMQHTATVQLLHKLTTMHALSAHKLRGVADLAKAAIVGGTDSNVLYDGYYMARCNGF